MCGGISVDFVVVSSYPSMSNWRGDPSKTEATQSVVPVRDRRLTVR